LFFKKKKNNDKLPGITNNLNKPVLTGAKSSINFYKRKPESDSETY